MANTQIYNDSLKITSFGAEVVHQPVYNLSYKVSLLRLIIIKMNSSSNFFFTNDHQNIQIQGQIHHRAGALLPPPNEDHKFLQIYFVGNSAIELDQCCAITTADELNTCPKSSSL